MSSPSLSPQLLDQLHQIDDFFHHTYPEMKDEVHILARLSKITEEVGELTNEIHATLGFHKASPHKQDDPANLAKEWADVFNTVILMGIALDIDMNQAIEARLKTIFERYQLHDR